MPKECPTNEELSDYTLGTLSEAEHQVVEYHLDDCESCQDTVANLDEHTGPLFPQLGRLLDDSSSQVDPDLERLAARAKAIVGNEKVSGADVQPDANKRAEFDIPSGTIMGNYEVGEPIGGGNMGFVYRARHLQMNREVALKFVRSTLVHSTEARRRFQREIEAAAKLSHPNIVAAFDAGEMDNRYFLVLEYIEGSDLRDLVKDAGALNYDQAIDYIRQAASGLQFAHENGIVHRDIKPSNLLVDSQGQLKVTDLGLARDQQHTPDSNDRESTQTGWVAGTPAFMSPEQRLGLRNADERSDIYSLGCTLFYLLTGRLVSQATGVDRVLKTNAPATSEFPSDCPPEVVEFTQAMLASDAERRPQSMAECVTRMDALSQIDRANPGNDPTRIREPLGGRGLAITALVGVAASIMIVSFLLLSILPGIKGREQSESNRSTDTTETQQESILNRDSGKPLVEMVTIEQGQFWMGSKMDDPRGSPEERPRHEVTISRSFMLGKFEITIAQYVEVMGVDPVIFVGDAANQDSADRDSMLSQPVAGISWFEAVLFCNQLSEKHGLTPFYLVNGDTVSITRGSNGYRLPTEAEWEFACRADTDTAWYFGDSPEQLSDFAWFAENSGGTTHPVGLKQPNGFGLHDMHGNVPEWCWDRFDAEYYSSAEAIDPPGSSRGDERIFRGGGVTSRPGQTRSAARNPLGGSYGFFNQVGLRVARNIP